MIGYWSRMASCDLTRTPTAIRVCDGENRHPRASVPLEGDLDSAGPALGEPSDALDGCRSESIDGVPVITDNREVAVAPTRRLMKSACTTFVSWHVSTST